MIRVLKTSTDQRTNKDRMLLYNNTKDLDFFKKLDSKDKAKVANWNLTALQNSTHYKCCRCMHYGEYTRGETIVRHGEIPDRFYIMVYGKSAVLVPTTEEFQSQTRTTLKEILDHPYESGPLTQISRSELQQMGSKILEGSSSMLKNWDSIEDSKIIYQKSFIQKTFNELDLYELESRLDYFDQENGCLLFNYVASILNGKVFGEMGLLTRMPRSATIIAENNVITAIINKSDYHKILHAIEMNRVRDKLSFIEQQAFGMELLCDFRWGIPFMFTKIKKNPNSYVYNQGDTSQDLYIIKTGEVLLYKKIKRPSKHRSHKHSLTKGQ
jgi:CRP-like cAMP-binding protein